MRREPFADQQHEEGEELRPIAPPGVSTSSPSSPSPNRKPPPRPSSSSSQEMMKVTIHADDSQIQNSNNNEPIDPPFLPNGGGGDDGQQQHGEPNHGAGVSDWIRDTHQQQLPTSSSSGEKDHHHKHGRRSSTATTNYLRVGRRMIMNIHEPSCYLISGDSSLRHFCFDVIDHWVFDVVLIILILYNLAYYIIDSPFGRDLSGAADLIKYSEYTIQGLFAVEILMKIIALGFIMHPYAYCRDPLRFIEMGVVICGFIAIPLTGSWTALRGLKLIRLFRVMERVMQYVPELRGMFDALVGGLPRFADIVLFVAFLVVALSIIGVQLFRGTFHQRCYFEPPSNDTSPTLSPTSTASYSYNNLNYADSVTSNYRDVTSPILDPLSHWPCAPAGEAGFNCYRGATCMSNTSVFSVDYTNFDHLGLAAITVLKITSLDNIQQDIRRMQYTSGSATSIFGVVIVFLIAFCAMNFFIALLSWEYDIACERHLYHEKAKQLELTEAPWQDPPPPNDEFFQEETPFLGGVRQFLHDYIVGTAAFFWFSVFVTTGNVVILAIYYDGMSTELAEIFDWINFGCGIFYVFEMAIKLFCFYDRYFHLKTNIFDGFLACFIIAELATLGKGASLSLFAALRAIRMLRIFSLAVKFERARQLLLTVASAAKASFLLFLLLITYVALFALVALYIFEGSISDKRPNFADLPQAILAMFIIQAGEDWVSISRNVMQATSGYAAFFFFLFFFFGTYLLLNLFVVIVIASYKQTALQIEAWDAKERERKKSPRQLLIEAEREEEEEEEDGAAHQHEGDGAALSETQKKKQGEDVAAVGEQFRKAVVVVDISEQQQQQKQQRNNNETNNKKERPSRPAPAESMATIEFDDPDEIEGAALRAAVGGPSSGSGGGGGAGGTRPPTGRHEDDADDGHGQNNNNNNSNTEDLSVSNTTNESQVPKLDFAPIEAIRSASQVRANERAASRHRAASSSSAAAAAGVGGGSVIAPRRCGLSEEQLRQAQHEEQQRAAASQETPGSGGGGGSGSGKSPHLQAETPGSGTMSSTRKVRQKQEKTIAHHLAAFMGVEYLTGETIADSLRGSSFFIFARDSQFRILCAQLVSHPFFEFFTTVVVLESLIMLGFESQQDRTVDLDALTRGGLSSDPFRVNNIVISAWFTFEMLLKMIAFQVFLKDEEDIQDTTYFSQAWNKFDFIVVIITILSNFVPVNFLKALRIFRFAAKWHNQRVVLSAMLRAIPGILNVVVLVLAFVFLVAVLGVQLFQGRFASCNDKSIVTKAACNGTYTVYQTWYERNLTEGAPSNELIFHNASATAPRRWVTPFYNFDNTLNGLVTSLLLFWNDGWVDVMWNAVDSSADPNLGLQQTSWNTVPVIYFIFFMIVGNFFLHNLFIGTLLDLFKRQHKYEMGLSDAQGNQLLSSDQELWVRNFRFAQATSLPNPPPAPHSRFRKLCCWLYFEDEKMEEVSTTFEFTISMAVFINVALMATEYDGMSEFWRSFLWYENLVLTCVFGLEVIISFTALTFFQFFEDPNNIFNLLVTAASFVSMQFAGPGFNVLRVIRIFRVLRVIRKARGVYKLFQALVYSTPQIINISILLLLLLYLFGVAATSLFGNAYIDDTDPDEVLGTYYNFQHPGFSILTLLQLATTDGWAKMLEKLAGMDMENSGCVDGSIDKACGNWYAIPFFILFILCAHSIAVNLYIFVIVDNVLELNELNDVRTQWMLRQLGDFRRLWMAFDKKRTKKLKWQYLVLIIRHMLVMERNTLKEFRREVGMPIRVYRSQTEDTLVVQSIIDERSAEKHSAAGLELQIKAHYKRLRRKERRKQLEELRRERLAKGEEVVQAHDISSSSSDSDFYGSDSSSNDSASSSDDHEGKVHLEVAKLKRLRLRRRSSVRFGSQSLNTNSSMNEKDGTSNNSHSHGVDEEQPGEHQQPQQEQRAAGIAATPTSATTPSKKQQQGNTDHHNDSLTTPPSRSNNNNTPSKQIKVFHDNDVDKHADDVQLNRTMDMKHVALSIIARDVNTNAAAVVDGKKSPTTALAATATGTGPAPNQQQQQQQQQQQHARGGGADIDDDTWCVSEKFLLKRLEALSIPVMAGGVVDYNDCVFGLTRSHAGCSTGDITGYAKEYLSRVRDVDYSQTFQVHHAVGAMRVLRWLRNLQAKQQQKLEAAALEFMLNAADEHEQFGEDSFIGGGGSELNESSTEAGGQQSETSGEHSRLANVLDTMNKNGALAQIRKLLAKKGATPARTGSIGRRASSSTPGLTPSASPARGAASRGSSGGGGGGLDVSWQSLGADESPVRLRRKSRSPGATGGGGGSSISRRRGSRNFLGTSNVDDSGISSTSHHQQHPDLLLSSPDSAALIASLAAAMKPPSTPPPPPVETVELEVGTDPLPRALTEALGRQIEAQAAKTLHQQKADARRKKLEEERAAILKLRDEKNRNNIKRGIGASQLAEENAMLDAAAAYGGGGGGDDDDKKQNAARRRATTPTTTTSQRSTPTTTDPLFTQDPNDKYAVKKANVPAQSVTSGVGKFVYPHLRQTVLGVPPSSSQKREAAAVPGRFEYRVSKFFPTFAATSSAFRNSNNIADDDQNTEDFDSSNAYAVGGGRGYRKSNSQSRGRSSPSPRRTDGHQNNNTVDQQHPSEAGRDEETAPSIVDDQQQQHQQRNPEDGNIVVIIPDDGLHDDDEVDVELEATSDRRHNKKAPAPALSLSSPLPLQIARAYKKFDPSQGVFAQKVSVDDGGLNNADEDEQQQQQGFVPPSSQLLSISHIGQLLNVLDVVVSGPMTGWAFCSRIAKPSQKGYVPLECVCDAISGAPVVGSEKLSPSRELQEQVRLNVSNQQKQRNKSGGSPARNPLLPPSSRQQRSQQHQQEDDDTTSRSQQLVDSARDNLYGGAANRLFRRNNNKNNSEGFASSSSPPLERPRQLMGHNPKRLDGARTTREPFLEEDHSPTSQPQHVSPPPRLPIAQVLFDFAAEHDLEVSVFAGEIVEITSDDDGFGWTRIQKQQRHDPSNTGEDNSVVVVSDMSPPSAAAAIGGLVPTRYLQPMSPPRQRPQQHPTEAFSKTTGSNTTQQQQQQQGRASLGSSSGESSLKPLVAPSATESFLAARQTKRQNDHNKQQQQHQQQQPRRYQASGDDNNSTVISDGEDSSVIDVSAALPSAVSASSYSSAVHNTPRRAPPSVSSAFTVIPDATPPAPAHRQPQRQPQQKQQQQVSQFSPPSSGTTAPAAATAIATGDDGVPPASVSAAIEQELDLHRRLVSMVDEFSGAEAAAGEAARRVEELRQRLKGRKTTTS